MIAAICYPYWAMATQDDISQSKKGGGVSYKIPNKYRSLRVDIPETQNEVLYIIPKKRPPLVVGESRVDGTLVGPQEPTQQMLPAPSIPPQPMLHNPGVVAISLPKSGITKGGDNVAAAATGGGGKAGQNSGQNSASPQYVRYTDINSYPFVNMKKSPYDYSESGEDGNYYSSDEDFEECPPSQSVIIEKTKYGMNVKPAAAPSASSHMAPKNKSRGVFTIHPNPQSRANVSREEESHNTQKNLTPDVATLEAMGALEKRLQSQVSYLMCSQAQLQKEIEHLKGELAARDNFISGALTNLREEFKVRNNFIEGALAKLDKRYAMDRRQ